MNRKQPLFFRGGSVRRGSHVLFFFLSAQKRTTVPHLHSALSWVAIHKKKPWVVAPQLAQLWGYYAVVAAPMSLLVAMNRPEPSWCLAAIMPEIL